MLLLLLLGIIAVVLVTQQQQSAAATGSDGGTLLGPTPSPLLPGPHPEYDQLIIDACANASLNDDYWPLIVKAIIQRESGWNPLAGGDSGSSVGLMQVDLNFHPEYTRAQLQDPAQNITAGVTILSAAYYEWGNPWTAARRYNGCVNRPYKSTDPGSGQPVACNSADGYWGYAQAVYANFVKWGGLQTYPSVPAFPV